MTRTIRWIPLDGVSSSAPAAVMGSPGRSYDLGPRANDGSADAAAGLLPGGKVVGHKYFNTTTGKERIWFADVWQDNDSGAGAAMANAEAYSTQANNAAIDALGHASAAAADALSSGANASAASASEGAAQASATAAGLSASAAGASETAAGLSEMAAQASATAAGVSASTATTQAAIATTKADEAGTSADTATTQAGIATAQAAIATTKATDAAASASTATTQAGAATTKATEAATSASAGAASASAAAASATSAAAARDLTYGYAQDAASDAASAAASALSADADATTATAQAGIATTKAGEAFDSALSAGGFETPEYASQAAGEAATTEGDIFRVPLGTTPQTFNWYRRLASGSELVSPLATTGYLDSSAGAGAVGFIQSGTGAVTRTVQAKLRDIVSVKDFSSHEVADAAGVELYNPSNVTSTRANGAAVVSPQWGPGRVTTANGNKRGKWFSNVTSAPAALGNHDSIETAFNGDLSRSIFQIEHRITGAATLSQPASGYVYTPEAYPFYGVLYNTSGHNESTTGNGGRTVAVFSRVAVKQYGQGDAVCYNASGFVASQKSGATHFLAQPAVVLFNGDAEAGINYVYLNPYETNCHDNGYDVAHIGAVYNGTRTNATGGQSCWWGGVRVQSNGSAAWNNVISASGKFDVFLDAAMSATDLGTNKALISGKAGQRIYLNNYSTNGNYTDGFNGDYLEYSSGISGFNFAIGGNSRLQVNGSQVTAVGVPVVAPCFRAYAATATAAAGQLAIGTTTATSATAGASGATPAQVLGYLVMSLGGTAIKVPYYAS